MVYFSENEYLIRRKILKLLGGAFHVYDAHNSVVAYSKMKAFKLKEDLRMFTGEDMEKELFRIQARNIIDFAATYDVFDSSTGSKIGALRRRGLKSIFADEWLILDAQDREIGTIKEDSLLMAFVRRFLVNIIPQSYHCTIQDRPACTFKQNFNPFVMKIRVRFEECPDVDRNLVMAGGLLLCAIEGKQKD